MMRHARPGAWRLARGRPRIDGQLTTRAGYHPVVMIAGMTTRGTEAAGTGAGVVRVSLALDSSFPRAASERRTR